MNDRLSKSAFVRGLQCPKSLYLHRYRPDLRDKESEGQQAIFAQGTNVGHLARALFPGGVAADEFPPDSSQPAYTSALMERGARVVFEGAFVAAGTYCAVDVLRRVGRRWEAIEVKSSTGINEVHLNDAALQYFVLRSSGLPISDFSIAYLDNTYERGPDLDVGRLFRIESVLAECKARCAAISRDVERLRGVLRASKAPDVDIGEHCSSPYACDFQGHCWQHVPEDSIFQLTRVRRSRLFSLYNAGVVRLDDLPVDSLSAHASMQLAAHRLGGPIMDLGAIYSFVEGLEFPLSYMDFETIFPAIPRFALSRPYQQIPFEFCVGVQDSPEREPRWIDFLATAGIDPRRAFIERLLQVVPKNGSVVVYNQSFEIGRLHELALLFPEYSRRITQIIVRVRDLHTVFRNGHYYHPDMRGSTSLKAVLPIFAPDLSYDDLMIQDGGMASQAYEALLAGTVEDVDKVRASMIAYCRRDTEGMYRIWQGLSALLTEETNNE